MPRDPAPSEIEVALRPASLPSFAAVVTLRGEHDLASRPELRRLLASIRGDTLVDLSDCPFVDCSVIGELIGASRALTRAGHRLELVLPPANAAVTRVVDIVGLREAVSVLDRRPVEETVLSRG